VKTCPHCRKPVRRPSNHPDDYSCPCGYSFAVVVPLDVAEHAYDGLAYAVSDVALHDQQGAEAALVVLAELVKKAKP
jgi:hypothetical protein